MADRRVLQLEIDARVADLLDAEAAERGGVSAVLSDVLGAWAESVGETIEPRAGLVRATLSVHERRNRR